MKIYTKPTVKEGEQGAIKSVPHQTRCSGQHKIPSVKF